jgi:hypothetical protein
VSGSALFITVFLACRVEAVQALTIILVTGTARDWRSAVMGSLAGVLVLVVSIAALGPAISAIPLDGLRLFVGGLLLVFGLQWLRKAILRASGFKAFTTRRWPIKPRSPTRSTRRRCAGCSLMTGMHSLVAVFKRGTPVDIAVAQGG